MMNAKWVPNPCFDFKLLRSPLSDCFDSKLHPLSENSQNAHQTNREKKNWNKLRDNKCLIEEMGKNTNWWENIPSIWRDWARKKLGLRREPRRGLGEASPRRDRGDCSLRERSRPRPVVVGSQNTRSKSIKKKIYVKARN